MVPEFAPSSPESKIPRSPGGSPGVYDVIFILGVPGKQSYFEDIDIDKALQSGESLFVLPREAAVLTVNIRNNGDHAQINYGKASNGTVSSARIRITARGFDDAAIAAYDLVAPTLSWWSVRLNAATDIIGYHITEERTKSTMIHFGFIGKTKPLPVYLTGTQLSSKPEYRTLFAAYREALNSTTPFYRFLSFFKVVEGIFNRRNIQIEEQRARGERPSVANERFPGKLEDLGPIQPEATEIFRDHLGKKFTSVRDELRPIMRNAIAHIDPTQPTLEADKVEGHFGMRESHPSDYLHGESNASFGT